MAAKRQQDDGQGLGRRWLNSAQWEGLLSGHHLTAQVLDVAARVSMSWKKNHQHVGMEGGGADASSPAALAHPLMPKSAGELLGKTLIWRPIHKTAWNVGELWLHCLFKRFHCVVTVGLCGPWMSSKCAVHKAAPTRDLRVPLGALAALQASPHTVASTAT